MKDYQLKQLEALGKLQWKKVPNFTHIYTQDEYDLKLQKIEQKLLEIQKNLSSNLNRVQYEILKICNTKILEVFRYYMNIRTWKVNKQNNRIFKKYIRELKNFKRKYLGTNKNERDFIDSTIESMIHDFLSQRNYIMQLEKKIKSSNITPFENTIEILDNSIRKVLK
jgi:hypothetical protein